MKTPRLIVLAGPNGAGKSTFARRHIIGRVPFVNADDIARSIAPQAVNQPATQLQAGRLAIKERERLLQAGASFAFETTLTGKGELRLMERAVQKGYKIYLAYIGLQNAAASATRVGLRVASGGHDVPAEDIDRRFARSMAALPKALALAHRAWVFDNSGRRRRPLCVRNAGQTIFLAKDLPQWAVVAIPANVRQVTRSRRI